MAAPPPGSVTRLLVRWRAGDRAALDELVPLVYDELRRIASRQMRAERPGHALQATALVHEAFVRLVDMEVTWQDRAHFLGVAARAMRRILVDHARARDSAKRGGGAVKVDLLEAASVASEPPAGMTALDEALTRLAAHDGRKALAVELIYFGGLTHEEAAAVLEVSVATVERDLRQARAWLHRELR